MITESETKLKIEVSDLLALRESDTIKTTEVGGTYLFKDNLFQRKIQHCIRPTLNR